MTAAQTSAEAGPPTSADYEDLLGPSTKATEEDTSGKDGPSGAGTVLGSPAVARALEMLSQFAKDETQEVLTYEADALLPDERNAVRIAAFDLYGLSARSKGPKTSRRLVVSKPGTVRTSPATAENTKTQSESAMQSASNGYGSQQAAQDGASSASCVRMPPPELPPSAPHSEDGSRWPSEQQQQQQQQQRWPLQSKVGISGGGGGGSVETKLDTSDVEVNATGEWLCPVCNQLRKPVDAKCYDCSVDRPAESIAAAEALWSKTCVIDDGVPIDPSLRAMADPLAASSAPAVIRDDNDTTANATTSLPVDLAELHESWDRAELDAGITPLKMKNLEPGPPAVDGTDSVNWRLAVADDGSSQDFAWFKGKLSSTRHRRRSSAKRQTAQGQQMAQEQEQEKLQEREQEQQTIPILHRREDSKDTDDGCSLGNIDTVDACASALVLDEMAFAHGNDDEKSHMDTVSCKQMDCLDDNDHAIAAALEAVHEMHRQESEQKAIKTIAEQQPATQAKGVVISRGDAFRSAEASSSSMKSQQHRVETLEDKSRQTLLQEELAAADKEAAEQQQALERSGLDTVEIVLNLQDHCQQQQQQQQQQQLHASYYMGPYSSLLSDNLSPAILPDVMLCVSDPSMQGLAPEDDTRTVVDELADTNIQMTYGNEWNYILSRLVAADVTMVFTARTAKAAERLVFWLQGRPGLRIAPGAAQRNIWRSLRPLLGEPLADASVYTHPAQEAASRKAEASREAAAKGRKKGNSAAARAEREELAAAARAEELRQWTETLGGEDDGAHGLNTSYNNQYVVIATRDDRRYSVNES
jgi:hypothetical protein